ncbi:hypothetical protein ABPG72_019285 [Tetrahymena utriculariae]
MMIIVVEKNEFYIDFLIKNLLASRGFNKLLLFIQQLVKKSKNHLETIPQSNKPAEQKKAGAIPTNISNLFQSMDYLKEKSRDSDDSQLIEDQDGNRKIPEKSIKKKDPRNFSSPNNNEDKTPLSFKFLFQWMLLYWRENFKPIFNQKGMQLRSDDQLDKEETLEYFGVFAQGIKRTKHLEKLNLSGTDIHPYLLIEIAQAMTVNRSIKELNLSGSTLSSFMLSYLFKRLVSNKSLQVLNLSNNQNFDMEAVQDLIQLILHKQNQKNQLKVLDISHCNIDCMSLSLLCSSLSNTNQLTSINLSLMNFPPIALLALAKALSKNKSIQQLNISFNRFGEKGLNTLTSNISAWGVSNIKYLNISGNNISSDKEVGRLLEKIPCCQNVDLSYNKLKSINSLFNKNLNQHLEILKLTGNLIESIPDDMFTNLTHLDLSCNQIKFKGANKIAKKLRQIPNPKWTHLYLDRNQIESEGFNDIIYSLRDNQTLKHLSFAYNQLDGESVICMIVNYDALQLEHLDITGNQIHYSIVFVFLKLMKQCKLKKLSFCDLNNDTKGEGLHESKFALNCEALKELDFSGNEHISCSVVSSLQNRFNNIEILNLKGCSPFHDQDLINLSNFIKKSDFLRHINLRGLNIGSLELKSVEYFSQNLKLNNKLQYINLSKNKLTMQFQTLTILLPGLGKCSNLESLDLSNNRITQKHRYHMQRMIIKSKSLKTLTLSNNLISLENLLTLNLEDQWELFFKNHYIQKLRKQMTQNVNNQSAKQNSQNISAFASNNNNNNNNNNNGASNLNAVSNNYQINSATNISNLSNLNLILNVNGNGVQNFIGNNSDLLFPKNEEACARQLEEKKKEFLREYKKILKNSMSENQMNSLLRLRVRCLNLSSLRLRADDLRVLGQILGEGEIIKELNLSNNLDFGKANFVAQNLLCDSQMDSISLCHQTFRNQQNFKHLFGGNVRLLQQILLNRDIFDQTSFSSFCSSLAAIVPHQTLKVFHAQNLIVPIKILPELITILIKCKSLEILKLRKLIFDDKFCTQLQLLITTSNNLKLIDLSQNSFTQAQFDCILRGFDKNKTIRNFIFERMQIPQNMFEQLFKCLCQSPSLKLIDLANNSFTKPVMEQLGILIQKSIKLKFLNLSFHRNQNPKAPQKKKTSAMPQNTNNKKSGNGNSKFQKAKKYSAEEENFIEQYTNNNNINAMQRNNKEFFELENQGVNKNVDYTNINSQNPNKRPTAQDRGSNNIEDYQSQTETKKTRIHDDLKEIKKRIYSDYFICIDAFEVFMQKSCARNSLRHLDLSACGLTEDHLAILVDTLCSPDCQVKSLNIPSNPIINENSSHLKRLLCSQTCCLQELNLKYCRLTSTSYLAICEGLFEGRGLKCLDISENQEGDLFCEFLNKEVTKRKGSDRNKLQFLFVNKMEISFKGNEHLKSVLKKMPHLFISNEWVQADNKLAELILQSYQNVFKHFNFIPNMIPSYLKKLSITDSFICDQFCINLSKKFYEYEFLEYIDLSNNPFITSIGKIYLFLHLFDIRFDNSKLKTLYVQNNSKSFQNQSLVDEGILSWIAYKFSDIQRQLGFISRLYARVLSTKYLIPTKFQLNQHLNGVLERRSIPYHIVIILMLHICQFLTSWIPLPLYLNDELSINDDKTNKIWLIFICSFALFVQVIELIAVCRERLKSNLLLQTDELYPAYWKSFINTKEILFMILGLIGRFDGFTDSVLIGLFKDHGYESLMGIALVIALIKILKTVILFLQGLFRWKKINGKEEMSNQLQNYWRLFLGQGFYVTENFMNKFSPSDSIKLSSKISINYKTLFHFLQLIIESLPQFVLYLLYALMVDNDIKKTSVTESVIMYAICKQIIQIVHQFFTFLLFKPSQIGQTHFDEALITLQYKKALEKYYQSDINKKPSSLLTYNTRPSNYSNLRSLLNTNRFRDEIQYKMKINQFETGSYNSFFSTNYQYGEENIMNETVDDDKFQEKYMDGMMKKNKYTFSAGRNKEENSSEEELEEEDRNFDESISVSTIIDENGPSVNLPNSLFNPNQPKFINNLSLLNQRHCKI